MRKPKKEVGRVRWPTDPAAIEAKLIALRADPEYQGWQRLTDILNQAVVDPAIRSTENAQWVAQVVRELLYDIHTASAHDFVLLLERKIATMHAKQKGCDQRAWVQGEWKQHATAYDGNKSAFARHYVNRLLRERKYSIGVRTITDIWLKDS